MTTFTVTMQGESGELEVFDNPGADRTEIDSWDAAIRAAWVRLGETGEGWESAVVAGPSGVAIHLRAADKAAYFAGIAQRVRAEQDAYEAAVAADPSMLSPLFDDES
jgi:hypothetical protein